MPMRLKEKTGLRYGRLVAIKYLRDQKKWLCKCDCGTEKLLKGSDVGRVKSCGCLIRDVLLERNVRHGDSFRGKVAPEYRAWCAMIRRCYDEHSSTYSYYGGRGITVCDGWRSSYECFLQDVGRKPSMSHSLDRINNNGNYEPGNVRWATKDIQSANRRARHVVEFRGRTFVVSQAARLAGLPLDLVLNRLKRGWSAENALTTPVLPIFGGTGIQRFSHNDQAKELIKSSRQ